MKTTRYAWIASVMLHILFRSAVIAQLPLGTATGPHEANLIYNDVKNFIKALNLMSSVNDSAAIVQREYLDEPASEITVDKLYHIFKQEYKEFNMKIKRGGESLVLSQITKKQI